VISHCLLNTEARIYNSISKQELNDILANCI
jgi:hypothetical protein